MNTGTLLSVIQTLLTALHRDELKEMCLLLGHKFELEYLQRIVSTLKVVLLDADAKHELICNEPAFSQSWIDEVRELVYNADDLLDEFLMLAERKQLMESDQISEKVRILFSRLNLPGLAYSMSRRLKEIGAKLETDSNEYHTQFDFKLDYLPVSRGKDETFYHDYASSSIIGREEDTEWIVSRLQDFDVVQDVNFLSIVGVGGLGKTALARMVYNDVRTEKEFPLRLWVCVSDQDPNRLDLKDVFGRILESAIRKKNCGFTDQVESQLQRQLAGRKYLLVLDDVRIEDHIEWKKLADMLMVGGRGSWILVTTRSKETAAAVGGSPMYELQGLSKEMSWQLFERTAFKLEHGQEKPPDDLVDVGKDIIRECPDVPLAIKVVGSLLYCQDIGKWLSFQKVILEKKRWGLSATLSILKFSFHLLEPPLKSCFSYCAIFPRDFIIYKKMLISLWIAQGYVVPMYEGQSQEDAGEEYFSILLHRCFFQDVEKDVCGEIISCKMHDLTHEISKQVAGNEIFTTNYLTSDLVEKIRHLGLIGPITSDSFVNQCKIRTCLQVHQMKMKYLKSDPVLPSNFTCLRTLDLHGTGIKNLPKAIGELQHLRYLDLSDNILLTVLPSSITELHNLQTLMLQKCLNLRELPKDLSKLVNLRILDTKDCYSLIGMPVGMGELRSLHTLTRFIVGPSCSSSEQCLLDQLEDLKALTNLATLLIKINVPKNAVHIREKVGEYIKTKLHLKSVTFIWDREKIVDYHEALMEDLQPPANLRELVLQGYCGVRMPTWAREDNLVTFLPNLVCIRIEHCHGLQCLTPLLGKLRYLKKLTVFSLKNLEYMENETSRYSDIVESSSVARATKSSFFPSLEELILAHLPKLKAWWRGMEDSLLADSLINCRSSRLDCLPSFPHLSRLYILDCPDLSCIPLCPSLNILRLENFNNRLVINRSMEQTGMDASSASYLRSIQTDGVVCLKSMLPAKSVKSLAEMKVLGDNTVENFSEVGVVFQGCSSSLCSLEIWNCPKLKTLCGGMEHLTALVALSICNTPKLRTSDGAGEGDIEPWQSLHKTLRILQLKGLPKMRILPAGIQYLTALQSLTLADCYKLEGLPGWMGSLTSLQSLEISYCKRIQTLPNSMQQLTSLKRLEVEFCSACLKQRSHNPTGQDWINILHIPHVLISESSAV